MSEDDRINISKEELFSGRIADDKISAMAKLTAKQIYSQGYQAGEAANVIDVWNEAIEEAAKIIDSLNRQGPYMAIIGATEIRKLKK